MGDSLRDFNLPLPRGLTSDSMPSEYGGSDQEAYACINSAALFDFSFI